MDWRMGSPDLYRDCHGRLRNMQLYMADLQKLDADMGMGLARLFYKLLVRE
jgi:hypothetical protein